MKNLIIRLVLVAMILAIMPSANIAHAEGGNSLVAIDLKSLEIAAAAAPGQFYVAPDGKPTNAGTWSSPWDLQTALNQPAAVVPGSVIWVKGGTYKGAFVNRLKGRSDAYITVWGIPDHRAILMNPGGPVLDIASSYYVHFVNLEITSSYSTRSASRSSSTYGVRVRQGDSSHHVNFLNMIFHDMQAQGIGWWQALKDSMIYGSLFYYNGTTQLDHGVYAHNTGGWKIFKNNIVFDNASHGFHGYAETSEKGLNNFLLEGNTFFNNGSIGLNTKTGKYGEYKRNILVGGLVKTTNAYIISNYTYFPGSAGNSFNLGYSAGSTTSYVYTNYFAGGSYTVGGSQAGYAMAGNVVYAPGGVKGISSSNYPNNSFLSNKPAGVQPYVRVNEVDNRRANITIYNWDKYNHVYLSAPYLNGLALRVGQTYELRNVQDYFSDIMTGVYDGKGMWISMTNHSVAQPMGLNFKPASTFPEFGAFVLIAK